MNFRFSWFGIALIVIGLGMVLHRLGMIPFEWPTVLWVLVAVAGLLKLVHAFTYHRRGSAFFGTLLFVAGVSLVIDHTDIVTVPSNLLPPFFVLAIGIGFLMMFLVAPKEWHILIPAAAFLVAGSAMVLAEGGYLLRWDVEEAVRTYWPAALIVFGGALLLSRQSVR